MRRLACVLFSDLVGFTAAMGQDEERTIRAVSEGRELQSRLIEKFRGTLIQWVGDGTLCVFESSLDAATCAIEMQRAFRARNDLQLRIGIHVGELVFRGSGAAPEVFGDAVNVAARIQALGEPGTINISERVHDDLSHHAWLRFVPLGSRKLKGVKRPVTLYRILDVGGPRAAGPLRRRQRLAALALAGLGIAGLAVWQLLPAGGDDGALPPVAARPPTQPPPKEPDDLAIDPEPKAPEPLPPLPAPPAAPDPSHEASPPIAREPGEAGERLPPDREPREIAEDEARPKGATPPGQSDRERHAPEPPPVEGAPPSLGAPLPHSPPTRTLPEAEPDPDDARRIVEQTIREILEVVRDPNLSPPVRQNWIEHIAYARFDFETFSRLVLHTDWLRFSQRQRIEFMDQFEVALALRYSGKIASYDQERVAVRDLVIHDRGEVTVRTVILGRRPTPIPVDYRMRERHGWRAIDVTIDGVSLVSSYRDQFASVLKDGSPQDLLDAIRAKNAEGLKHGREATTALEVEYDAARRRLLDPSGSWQEASPRLWVEPNAVRSDESYNVSFEAACDCFALLFAVHSPQEAITLLYSSAGEGGGRLPSGTTQLVRARLAKELHDPGIYGTDMLALIVADQPFGFPQAPQTDWSATPTDPIRLAELETLLQGLESTRWASAVNYLQILR